MDMMHDLEEMEMEKNQKSKYGPYSEWEIKNAVNCILEAEEIKADKEKMKFVNTLLNKKSSAFKKAITSIQDIKDARQEKLEAQSESEG